MGVEKFRHITLINPTEGMTIKRCHRLKTPEKIFMGTGKEML